MKESMTTDNGLEDRITPPLSLHRNKIWTTIEYREWRRIDRNGAQGRP